jgi:hypothetical protein
MTATSQPLHPRYAEIVDYMARERAELDTYVGSLPDAVCCVRPGADSWSVADTLEHLAMLENSVGRLVSNLVKQAVEQGAVQDAQTGSLMGILDQWKPVEMRVKLVAPDRVRPTGEQPVAVSLASLATSRARLLQMMRDANGLDLTRVGAPHPYFGQIDGYQWLLLIAQHELRHLAQMKRAVGAIEGAQS